MSIHIREFSQQEFEDRALGVLRDEGEKITAGRVGIVRSLATATAPMTHADIFRVTAAAGTVRAKNTVSKTLQLLERRGVIVSAFGGYVPALVAEPTATLAVKNSATGRTGADTLPAEIGKLVRKLAGEGQSIDSIRVEITFRNPGEEKPAERAEEEDDG